MLSFLGLVNYSLFDFECMVEYEYEFGFKICINDSNVWWFEHLNRVILE